VFVDTTHPDVCHLNKSLYDL
jgi:hypothetical protein